MESKIRNLLDELMSKPGMNGVAIVDQNGLCLGSRGILNSAACGSLVHLMQIAIKLEPNKYPFLKLETDSSNIIMKTEENLHIILSTTAKK